MPYPDINFALFAPYEGFGYVSEAGRPVLQFWRDFVVVKEIFCGRLADNARPQRIAERIGFLRAGTLNVLFGHSPNEKHTINCGAGATRHELERGTYCFGERSVSKGKQ